MSRDSKPGVRRLGRECAVQLLYQLDAAEFRTPVDAALAAYWASDFAEGDDRPGERSGDR